jgi:hypothetical protein
MLILCLYLAPLALLPLINLLDNETMAQELGRGAVEQWVREALKMRDSGTLRQWRHYNTVVQLDNRTVDRIVDHAYDSKGDRAWDSGTVK